MTIYYVDTQGAVVRRADRRLVVTKDDEIIQEIKAIKADQLVIMGNIQITTPAIALVVREGIDVVFTTKYGGPRVRWLSRGSKVPRLRLQQLKRMLDEAANLALAKQIVLGKLRNQRALLLRQSRAAANEAARGIAQMMASLNRAQDADTLRGFEGKAGAYYWAAFKTLLQQNLGFQGRVFHPPPDPVNATLSFGYALLQKDIEGAVMIVGLDEYLGFFHALQDGRPSLALDLMEEFRPLIVDPIVLSLVNEGALTARDFVLEANPERPVLLSDRGRKLLIEAYEQRVNTRVRYPPLADAQTFRRIFELQARQLAHMIEEDGRTYQPMTMD